MPDKREVDAFQRLQLVVEAASQELHGAFMENDDASTSVNPYVAMARVVGLSESEVVALGGMLLMALRGQEVDRSKPLAPLTDAREQEMAHHGIYMFLLGWLVNDRYTKGRPSDGREPTRQRWPKRGRTLPVMVFEEMLTGIAAAQDILGLSGATGGAVTEPDQVARMGKIVGIEPHALAGLVVKKIEQYEADEHVAGTPESEGGVFASGYATGLLHALAFVRSPDILSHGEGR